MNTVELRPVCPSLRSCFRCGREFRCEGSNRICATCRTPKRGNRHLNPKLSFRESQVISLISQAKLNKEIAYQLHLAEGTIKEYLHRIFRKLGTTNRTELAIWALKQQSTQAVNLTPTGHHSPPLRLELQAAHDASSEFVPR
jgi:DNA-binding NarL/FixJ family response regulator